MLVIFLLFLILIGLDFTFVITNLYLNAYIIVLYQIIEW